VRQVGQLPRIIGSTYFKSSKEYTGHMLLIFSVLCGMTTFFISLFVRDVGTQ